MLGRELKEYLCGKKEKETKNLFKNSGEITMLSV
jgi:hypothetical protein